MEKILLWLRLKRPAKFQANSDGPCCKPILDMRKLGRCGDVATQESLPSSTSTPWYGWGGVHWEVPLDFGAARPEVWTPLQSCRSPACTWSALGSRALSQTTSSGGSSPCPAKTTNSCTTRRHSVRRGTWFGQTTMGIKCWFVGTGVWGAALRAQPALIPSLWSNVKHGHAVVDACHGFMEDKEFLAENKHRNVCGWAEQPLAVFPLCFGQHDVETHVSLALYLHIPHHPIIIPLPSSLCRPSWSIRYPIRVSAYLQSSIHQSDCLGSFVLSLSFVLII